MPNRPAIIAYNTSELLTLRNQRRSEFTLITSACTNRLRHWDHLAPAAVVDAQYLLSELDSGSVSAVVLARYDLPKILGMVGARIERMGRRVCLRAQRPYLAERPMFYGVQPYEVHEALKGSCLRYVLQHLILFRLDNAPPVREVEWHVAGMKCGDRYRLRGTELVRI